MQTILAKTPRLCCCPSRDTGVMYCVCTCRSGSGSGPLSRVAYQFAGVAVCVGRLLRSFGDGYHRCLWMMRHNTQKKTMFSPSWSVLKDSGIDLFYDGDGSTSTLFSTLPHPALTSNSARGKKYRRVPVATKEQEALDVWDWRKVAWGLGSTARK